MERITVRRWGGRALAAVAVVVPILTTHSAAATFANGVPTAGPEALTAATLVTPAGLALANGGCSGGNAQTNVTASWTASAVLDANGNSLVNGYNILRSTSSNGVYTSAGSVNGSPPPSTFTDTAPSGATTPQVFVGNNTTTVHAINSSTNAGTSITTGTVGVEPNALAVTPDGATVVVGEDSMVQVEIITVATDTVARTVALPKKSQPVGVAITPDGSTAYVTDAYNWVVYPITISSGAVGSGIAIGNPGQPAAILVTPDGSKVYAANYNSHSVSVISTATNAVVATVNIGAGSSGKPIALAVTPNSAHVYVADQGNGQIDDITTSSNTVTATVTAGSMVDANVSGGGDPNILAITPNGSKLYEANYTAGNVKDIAIPADTVSSTITITSGNPNALALTPNGCQVYVHDHANNKVDVISTASDTVTATPAVGATGDPTGMSVTPDSGHVYVANAAANTVSVISTSTNTVTSTLTSATVGTTPYAVLATPSTYYYKLQAQHGGWQSGISASVSYLLGWDQGGWQ